MNEASTTKKKIMERMEKLKKLHNARNESRNMNHTEVKKEFDRKTLPKNWEIREKKAEWLIKDKKERNAIVEIGLDYTRFKMLSTSAIEQEVFLINILFSI
jgi:pre-mRNA-splicing factor SYF2